MNEYINWDDGRRLNLSTGATAKCQALNPGQLYALFLYNSSNADHDIQATVVGSNSTPPVQVTVPGTTANEGLASIVLVSGNDTDTVSISIVPNGVHSTNNLDIWIGSVQMPTNTAGLNNQHLDATGQPQQFNKYCRYYSVPASHWYNVSINSNINQFISVQFQESTATVYIVNPTPNANARVTALGTVTENKDYTIVKGANPTPQTITHYLSGNGKQFVWMDADSEQNSEGATLALTSL
ncbi:hypothetical protein [Spartinivicinus poritis]|uniref:Lectin n=1 Tax=Spartinivicinus poritis TaxID=2994640 RepID=A0ABT5U290_9GAMM|nr:hypothetical protein [Spartinivicinus sp. A2-2]MDE1460494.1 hypothetical protein [Spartinivicinus sp. A2-2]